MFYRNGIQDNGIERSLAPAPITKFPQDHHFASKDSLFLWAFKSHKKYQESFPARFARPELAHVRVLRFKSPRALDAWLHELETRVG